MRGLSVDLEFVTPGVAAEVVMVVQNQDTRSGTPLQVEVSGRQPADAAAHDHQVVGVFGLLYGPPIPPVFQCKVMSRFP